MSSIIAKTYGLETQFTMVKIRNLGSETHCTHCHGIFIISNRVIQLNPKYSLWQRWLCDTTAHTDDSITYFNT